MNLLEKMLFTINSLSVITAEDYFKREGFVLQDRIDDCWLFVKPLKTDKAEVISLWQLGKGFSLINTTFFDEKIYKTLLGEAITKFGFEMLESDKVKVLGTDEFVLFLTQHENPPFTSFSAKLGKRNKEKLVAEVILNPPQS